MHRYPSAYISYLVEFHGARDYFECHEIMEEYWKEQKGAAFELTWLGLIQVAVASYHHRRGNFRGAAKMLAQAIRHSELTQLSQLGIDARLWLEQLHERAAQIERQAPFADLNLPLTDVSLLNTCMEMCKQQQQRWAEPSDMTKVEIIHKHKLRDRSEVIAERRRQLKLRHT